MMPIIRINNTTPSVADISIVNFPPNAPIDFGTLTKAFRNLTPQSTAPGSPNKDDIYLDDGTNTASGTLGFRRYTGTIWVDFGLQSTVGVAGLNDLSDVTITGVSDSDRLVYNATAAKWTNQNRIDGGTF